MSDKFVVLSINEKIDDFFSMVMTQINNGKTNFKCNKKSVSFDAERMITFANNHSCITCGLRGTIIKYEKMQNCNHHLYGNYHVNFYGVRNGHNIMMTVDHIILKSLGGPNHHSNYNTMCSDCNSRRGNRYENLSDFIAENERFGLHEYLKEQARVKKLNKEKALKRKSEKRKLMQTHCFEYYRYIARKEILIEN